MYRIYSIHLKNTNRRTGLYMTGNVVVYGVLGSWCLTPLSTIFQLHVHVQTVYHGRQFY